MAKTFEALSRSEGPSKENFLRSSPFQDWHCLDFRHMKQMGDLKQEIAFSQQKNNFKVFHFASTSAGEGVSTVIVNLAKSMADEKSGKNILLIDSNMGNPVLHAAFNTPSSPGLTEALIANKPYLQSIYKAQSIGLDVMPSGRPLFNVFAGIEQKKLADLLSAARDRYDCILIDSAPLLDSSDALSAAIAADTTFLVIQAQKIQSEAAEKAKHYLERNHCVIGGVILNRVLHVIPEWIYNRL